MTQLVFIDAYQSFLTTAQPFMNIANEEDYGVALNTLEQVLKSVSDTMPTNKIKLSDLKLNDGTLNTHAIT